MKVIQVVDQLGREISLASKVERIISLVPSQTELLFDLGLGHKVVGCTKFCVHPLNKTKSITRVGGTKNVNLDTIKNLKPDLIIANKEENTKEIVDVLSVDFPVWVSDVSTIEESHNLIIELGTLLGAGQAAENLVKEMKKKFLKVPDFKNKRILYFIWKSPLMVAGKDTYIDSVLAKLNLINCMEESRYPELDPEAVKNYSPEYIFLSSEPYPFKEKHLREFKKLFPEAQIRLVDGEMFSWFGSHLIKAADYFRHLFREIN